MQATPVEDDRRGARGAPKAGTAPVQLGSELKTGARASI
jgi:hypothetical protein